MTPQPSKYVTRGVLTSKARDASDSSDDASQLIVTHRSQLNALEESPRLEVA